MEPTSRITSKNQPLPIITVLTAYVGVLVSIFMSCTGWFFPSVKSKKPRSVPVSRRPSPVRSKTSSVIVESSSRSSSISWNLEEESQQKAKAEENAKAEEKANPEEPERPSRPRLRRQLSLPSIAFANMTPKAIRQSLASDDSVVTTESSFRRFFPEQALAGGITALSETPSKIMASSEAMLSKLPFTEHRPVLDVRLPGVKMLRTKSKKTSVLSNGDVDGNTSADVVSPRRTFTLSEVKKSSVNTVCRRTLSSAQPVEAKQSVGDCVVEASSKGSRIIFSDTLRMESPTVSSPLANISSKKSTEETKPATTKPVRPSMADIRKRKSVGQLFNGFAQSVQTAPLVSKLPSRLGKSVPGRRQRAGTNVTTDSTV